jgi:hypothetical protein
VTPPLIQILISGALPQRSSRNLSHQSIRPNRSAGSTQCEKFASYHNVNGIAASH